MHDIMKSAFLVHFSRSSLSSELSRTVIETGSTLFDISQLLSNDFSQYLIVIHDYFRISQRPDLHYQNGAKNATDITERNEVIRI